MRGFGLVAALSVLVSALAVACGTANVGGAPGAAGGASAGASNGGGGDGGDPAGNDGGSSTQGGTRASGGTAGEGSSCEAGSECPGELCGNGRLDPGETCDEGDRVPFDGCSATCQVESDCTDGCPSTCGDGFVTNTEACDDGNLVPNDGCSADCTVEPGFTCTAHVCEQTPNGCALRLQAVFRDFNASGAAGGHPDFQPVDNSQVVVPGLVEPELDLDGKPVQSASATELNGYMHGQASFAQWYRDTPGVNATIPGEIVLYDNGSGGYVNRWGANGELWKGQADTTLLRYCGEAGSACMTCDPPLAPGDQCFDPCTPWMVQYACGGPVPQTLYDGNPMFFPIDPGTPGILDDARYPSKIPPDYGWEWGTESFAATELGITTPIATAAGTFPSTARNFHFTTELRVLFRYDATKSLVLDFTGDDDVWVFVNGRIALDLGGWHPPLSGSVTIDSTTATSYGLLDTGIYSLSIFHAERQIDGSTFRLSLTGLDLERSACIRD